MEFAAGEKFQSHDEYGRGILVFAQGFGIAMRHLSSKDFHMKRSHKNQPIDVDEVLVEDNCFENERLTYHFAGFVKVLFIPRSVIIEVLEKNERAWKDCARWKYLKAALILRSLSVQRTSVDPV